MAELILERCQRLQLRADAHHLNAGVLVGEKGLTEAVMKEIDRALSDHGLLKVHVSGDDRQERDEIYHTVADKLGAARIQAIGKMLVFFRPIPEEKKKASEENAVRILMDKADHGARSAGKPAKAPVKKSPAKTNKSGKAKKEVKRVIVARPKHKRLTKKAALSK